ncbi:MAG: FHA domain-containing protein, partial [Deltaproteobacteria bacterium]|nr:FHA domain-containing protein [Deltaproteobacteria bacterium]
ISSQKSASEFTNSSISIPGLEMEAKANKNTAPDSVQDELDALLENEEDYFADQEEELEIPEVSEPSAPSLIKETPDLSHIPEVSRSQPDNSISNILRDIPLDEEEELQIQQAQGPKPSETETKVATTPPSSPQEMPEASLLLLEGNLDDHEYILGENTSIGRSPSNDLVLKEAKISRQHATITYRDGQYTIVDLKSSNGVLVNNKKVEEVTLQDGDEIRMGSFKFQFNLL